MDGVDIQQFITSHRAKLNQEKIRLQGDLRSSRGILPSGSHATEKAAMLRRERESEYNNFIKTNAPTRYHEVTHRPAPGKSITEVRRQMSRERDRELSTPVDNILPKEEGHEYDYSRLKEKKMAEERLYRNQGYKSHRARWDDAKPLSSVNEERGQFDGPSDKRQSWDSEEKDLVSWTRHQTNNRTRQTKATTPPPDTTSTRSNHLSSHRSISAPTPPLVGGITSLGGGDNDVERKRNRQREYAESLRAQMRDKEATKQNVIKNEKPRSPVHSRQAQRDKPEIKTMKSPRKDKHDHYLPYPPPQYPHYPPYPYMHPYYGPPPPGDMYYHHRPEGPSRPDPYRYPYYPPPPHDPSYAMNQYVPPHVPAHVHSMRQYDERSGREVSTSRRGFQRSPRDTRRAKFESNEQGDSKSNHFTSPIHGDSDRPTKQNKTSYREELEKQMLEKKERNLKTRLERERYEQKKEVEIYDPFGKGGCGAPVRDQHGNLVADLKRMRKINDERLGTSPRESQEFANSDEHDVITRKSLENKSSSESPGQTILKYDKVDDGTQKKVVQESYRDYLRKQVEEKEALKRKQKEEIMKEEKSELERIEKDRTKLKEDFKVEREKERRREEEARTKNEELKKEAEQKKRELTLKERERKYLEEQEASLLAEQQRLAFIDKMAQPVYSPQQQRSASPPIPTLRKQQNQGRNLPSDTHRDRNLPSDTHRFPSDTHQTREHPTTSYQPSSPSVPTLRPREQTTTFEQTTARSSSPPVPAVRKRIRRAEQSEPRPIDTQDETNLKVTEHSSNENKSLHRAHQTLHNADTTNSFPAKSANVATPTESSILTQLAALRMHLQSQLAEQHQVKPPSLEHRPKPRVTSGPRVRPQHTGAMLSTMDDFNTLKYRNAHQNQAFLSQFPDPPRSDSSLQVQQGALLSYQEDMLSKMRRRGGGKENKPEITGDLLSSASVGIPLNSTDVFSEESKTPPFLKLNSKPEPTHLPRPENRRHPNIARNASAGGPSQFSIATVDIDNMAIKNEERMRRLDAILNAGADSRSVKGGGAGADGRSGAGRTDDSQTILRNFLRRGDRQSFTRGSEKSLDCETTYQRLSTPSN